ncbi:hypothetical protein C427_1021 [Paraglaciecola psychrophila 170]|uniref:Uncharacterized protein n=1 Tax=Paraglaciecola psychrophila 170 TaxID=1129794 RepID=K7ADW2_9ALTE|nr:hypothetical protein C427_1021 [Paraglaciecola psychrophila 170]GAC38813.1 hypothetical protein GPSY_3202 [Paraglaciecola psychrophila 170]
MIHTQEIIGDFMLIIQRDSGEQAHHIFLINSNLCHYNYQNPNHYFFHLLPF